MTHPPIDVAALAARAGDLRRLHRAGDPLVLVNAWDVASARAVEAAGCRVVATTSAGMAAVFGLPDDDSMPPEPVFDLLARIVAGVGVPVTADVAGGFRLPPAVLAERLLAAGAVGCNLEDSDHARPGTLLDPTVVADRLAGVRAAASAAGVPLVINARIDTVLRHTGDPAEVLDDTVRRARLYLQAGADCVYPIGLAGVAAIGTVVEQTGGAPVNANLIGDVTVPELAAVGVSRISVGPVPHRRALAELSRFAAAVLPSSA